MRARRRLAALALALLSACAGPEPSASGPRAPRSAIPTRTPVANPTTAGSAAAVVGTSDGVSCEQAQADNVEEANLQGGGPADLTVSAFAETLNKGTYLEPCGVPNDSKVNICVAVMNGQPIGVTVGLDPADAEIETCVAKQVRAMTFASHPKMDVVRVRF